MVNGRAAQKGVPYRQGIDHQRLGPVVTPYFKADLVCAKCPERNSDWHPTALRLLPCYWSAFGEFAWDYQRWLRHGRIDDGHNLRYTEKRVECGLVWSPSRDCSLSLSGGYAFDRLFYEDEAFDDRDLNRIDVRDGPFLALSLKLKC